VLANADVLDPSQKLRASVTSNQERTDRAVSTTPIPADRAAQRYDAGGRLTTPGLIDSTALWAAHQRSRSPRRRAGAITATTTGVSAGDAGAFTYGALKHWVIGQSRTRLYAFVHISSIGLSGSTSVPEMLNIDYANVEACARICARIPTPRSG